MKKFVSLALLLFLAFGVTCTAYADSVLTLSAPDVEIDNNRLFDVVVYASCSDSLSAVTFELDYDSSLMEYRSVDTKLADGQVKAVDKNGKVKAVFLQGEGVAENQEIQLFSAKFKSINSGSCDVKISATDCVNNCAKELGCEPVTVCQVTVGDKAVMGDISSKSISSDNYSYQVDEEDKEETKAKKKDENKEKETNSEPDNGFSVAPDTSYKKYVYIFTLLLFFV